MAGVASRSARRRRLRVLTLRFMIHLRSLRILVAVAATFPPMQIMRLDAAGLILDAGHGKLYPLVPGNCLVCCAFLI